MLLQTGQMTTIIFDIVSYQSVRLQSCTESSIIIRNNSKIACINKSKDI